MSRKRESEASTTRCKSAFGNRVATNKINPRHSVSYPIIHILHWHSSVFKGFNPIIYCFETEWIFPAKILSTIPLDTRTLTLQLQHKSFLHVYIWRINSYDRSKTWLYSCYYEDTTKNEHFSHSYEENSTSGYVDGFYFLDSLGIVDWNLDIIFLRCYVENCWEIIFSKD